MAERERPDGNPRSVRSDCRDSAVRFGCGNARDTAAYPDGVPLTVRLQTLDSAGQLRVLRSVHRECGRASCRESLFPLPLEQLSVHMFNGPGSVDAPMDACDGAAPLTRIPSDGQYVVAAVFTRPIYAGEQAVNATVLVEGTVTLARPDAYTVSQLVLAGGGLVLTVWGYSRKWPPRFLLKK